MRGMPKSKFPFAEIVRLTETEEKAIAFAEELRWRGEITCHRCGANETSRLANRPGRHRCRSCRKQFSVRTGTPMESSRLPVSVWLRALWLILSSSKGISSLKLGEMLGIQQKSAWFLAHRVRAMMAWAVREPISGDTVELDEVYAGAPPRQKVGGGPTGVKSGRGPRRPLVLTAAIRGGEARFRVVGSHRRADISSAAGTMIRSADTFMTDALPAYRFLGTARRSVKHSAKEFVRNDPDGAQVHVNTAESCHADLRRMVLGVHHWISRKHLDLYLCDLAFRRSKRGEDLLGKLREAVSATSRIFYSDLVGIR